MVFCSSPFWMRSGSWVVSRDYSACARRQPNRCPQRPRRAFSFAVSFGCSPKRARNSPTAPSGIRVISTTRLKYARATAQIFSAARAAPSRVGDSARRITSTPAQVNFIRARPCRSTRIPSRGPPRARAEERGLFRIDGIARRRHDAPALAIGRLQRPQRRARITGSEQV